MRISRPETLAEAEALIAGGGVPVAGGSGFQLEFSQGAVAPAHYVRIGHLLPMGIYREIDGLCIGAGTPLEEIRQAGLPLLSEACRDVAAPNIRRLATLGGNLAWGKGCLIPALIALDATVETREGEVNILDYLAEPKGIVLYLTLRPLARQTWRKIGLRQAFTASIIASAGAMTLERGKITAVRLAVGGGATPPQRLQTVEDWLIGQTPEAVDRDILRERLEQAISAPDCAFRSARYRKRVAAAALSAGLFGLPERHAIRPVSRPKATIPPELTELSRADGGARWHTRPDMPAKIRGELTYLTDRRSPDMLVGRILRAGRPHARILSIDTAKAEALDGVAAVVTHRDIKGLNGFGILFQDQPALCADKVRYTGDPVAAVAAVDAETAARALALIEVIYEDLPVVTSVEAALAEESPAVHERGNLVTEVIHDKGDLAAGWAEAVHVVEDTYVTPRQMHGFMETEGGWAAPEGEGLVVCVGGQHGARDRMQLSRILALPEDKLRVITSPTGGAFGGKDELTVQPALALLAQKSGRPVRLHLSRAESVEAGIKRNPMWLRMKTGCDARGRIVAQEVEVLSDSGAYASLSPGVLETAMEHVVGPYEVGNFHARGRLAYTNNGIGGAFRGFGANQMTFAIECQIDRLAEKVGLDPIAMRRLNLRRPGSPGVLGQKVAPSERLIEMLDAAGASPLWRGGETGPKEFGPKEFGAEEMRSEEIGPEEIAGVGMALNYQGNGLGTIPEDEADFALALKGGKIEARCGLDEIGQGMVASLHAAISTRLGCGRDDVSAIFGDTKRAPDSGSTTASRGGYVVWRGVEETAPGFTAALLERASELLHRPIEELAIVPGGIGEARLNQPKPVLSFAELGEIAPVQAHYAFPKSDYFKGNARFIFAFGATLARVAVNRITGALRILDLEMHTAAGPVIDMASYLGQMEGGLVQGVGFTLTEDMPMVKGRPVAKNFDTYMMPGVRDVPGTMRVTAHEGLDPGDPFGPRGAGELGIGAVTPAIANAVADAIGRWPVVTPFPPEMILDLMEAAR
ncbi:molybdopterin cofactor-binding domain-containing protein [Celeribacter neptunius]|uniref:CO or xanthine dehydrogenase, Mo-binding subunit n=1 Tax=Celeribacter neptunius TaxID=588602 RepID=A0A1I3NMU6_9RHOB|nr:molybdopterin cofactor-binding domain-containing protein [Celeribacter neptunius]SFJ10250.1 CO or xanthine dehydrogenase, Mo-binding subunit [Celeribacter neptunius]